MDRHFIWCASRIHTSPFVIYDMLMLSIFAPSWQSSTKIWWKQYPILYWFKNSKVLIKLQNAAETLLQWFKDNGAKVNPDKYHLLINKNKKSFQVKIGNETVTNTKYKTFLGRDWNRSWIIFQWTCLIVVQDC